jgi:AraC-like DNA-binding protein
MNVYDLHKSNPDYFKQFSVKDILFVYYKCPQVERLVQLYTHFNQFTFTFAGKRTIHQGDKKWTVTKDSAYVLRRTAFLQEIHDDVTGWELIVFYIQDDYLKKFLNEFRNHLDFTSLPPPPTDMVIMMHVNDTIRTCYHSLIPYFSELKPPPDSILEMKVNELLYNILRHPLNKNVLAYVNHLTEEYKTPIWQIMESNYMYNLTIAEFARIADRSIASFKREFREYYNTSPGKWLTSRRLEKAKLLLKTSKRPIGDIAYDCGFENVSHFSRIYKDKYGVSPLNYRNSMYTD